METNYKSMGQFFVDVIKADQSGGYVTDDLRASQEKTAGYMEEGDLSLGGYLVPEQFQATLLQTSLESSIVKPRATVFPMATNRLTIPAVVDDDHATDYFGGIVISRTAEKAAKTEKNPAIGKVGLTLHKLTGLVYVTDELIEDSPMTIEPILSRLFAQAIAFVQDTDFLTGDGVNKALGAFNAANPSLIPVAAEAGQAVDTIIFENIIKMWCRMYPDGMSKAVWVANNNIFPQIAAMTIDVGAGGVPVWMPANGLAGLPWATLMGRPIIFSEKMATLGDQGDIGLADFSQYIIGEKSGGVQVAASMHIKFVEDEMAFRFVLRYDGQPWWLSTLTPLIGATLSPFVVLEAR